MRAMRQRGFPGRMVSLAITVLISLGLAGILPERAAAQTKVKLVLPVPPISDYVALWVALDKGFFKEEGIDLEFTSVMGSSAALAQVLGGNADVASVLGTTVLLARAEGNMVRSIFQLDQESIFSVMAFTESGVKTLRDLKGKKVGIAGFGGATHYVLRGALASAGLAERDVHLVDVGPFGPKALLAGTVQVLSGWNAQEIQLRHQGKNLVVWHSSAFMTIPPECVIATDKFIEKNPDLVRRFTRAYAKGIRYAVDHLDEAIASTGKYVQDFLRDRPLARAEVVKMLTVFESADSKTHGLGWHNPDVWRKGQDVMMQFGVQKKAIDTSQAFTNALLK